MNRAHLCAVALFAVLTGCAAPSRPPLNVQLGMIHSTGKSMLPAIPFDSTLPVKAVPFDQLKAGDVVIYWNVWAGCYVHHRILKRSRVSHGWVAKGDNNSRADRGLVTARNYCGVTPIAEGQQ